MSWAMISEDDFLLKDIRSASSTRKNTLEILSEPNEEQVDEHINDISSLTFQDQQLNLLEPDHLHGLRSHIISYIEKYIVNKEEVPENNIIRRLRIALKIIFPLLLGSTSGLTLIEPACQAAQGSPFFCTIFSGGTFLSLGLSSAWAGKHLVSQFDPISLEEREVFSESQARMRIKHLLLNTVACLSSFPAVFAVYKYNTEKWLIIPAFLSTMVFKSRGFYALSSFFTDLFKDSCNSSQKINRDHLISTIIDQKIFPLMIDETISLDHLKQNIKDLLEDYLDHNDSYSVFDNAYDDARMWKNGYPRKLTQLLSLVFPIGNALVSCLLSYEGLILLTSSSTFSLPAAIVITMPSFALDVMGTTSTVGKIFDLLYNKANGIKEKNIFPITFPKLSIGIPTVSLIISACYATSGAYITSDVISNSIFPSLKYILPWMVFATNTMFGTYASSVLGQDIVKQCIISCGSLHESTKFFINEKLETTKQLFSRYFSFR